ncbi:MAG TPA: ribosome maturation factor RimP [Candidatus Caccovivens faecavium]|nr:ribosome maturation factor RimP [Candidatus Caccovivens faecavium]
MAKVKEISEAKVRPIIEGMGYELVDVEYKKEFDGMSLIFTIDKEEGVTIDDCEKVNKAIDPIIDELNPTDDEPYTLVVSSPGLDRQLKTDRDLKRTLNKDVTLTLFSKLNGKKNFEGTLVNFDDKTVTIKIDDEEKIFDRDKIAGLKLVIKF